MYTAPLAIETGRYVGVPAEERMCHNCYEEVEDEIHFLTSCKCTELQRKVLYEHIQKNHPEFHLLTQGRRNRGGHRGQGPPFSAY